MPAKSPGGAQKRPRLAGGVRELYGKPVAVLCAAPSALRGTAVREALQRTLETQGATVVVSATIEVPPPALRSSELSADTASAVAEVLAALASAASAPLVATAPEC